MDAGGLAAGSHMRGELHVVRGRDAEAARSGADLRTCRVCGDEVGAREDGQPFVACAECGFPVCRPCYEYERSDGTQRCPQCNTRYKRQKGQLIDRAGDAANANHVCIALHCVIHY